MQLFSPHAGLEHPYSPDILVAPYHGERNAHAAPRDGVTLTVATEAGGAFNLHEDAG